MRNRTIPFGYQYQNGVLAVHPQESQTVRAVFAAYLGGEPLSKIAAHLTAKLVEYLPGHWQWDKARVKRLLDNAKYTGEDDFPPIIKEKDFQMAHQKKDSATPTGNRWTRTQAVQGLGPLPPLRRPYGAADGQPIRKSCHLEMSPVRLLPSSAR